LYLSEELKDLIMATNSSYNKYVISQWVCVLKVSLVLLCGVYKGNNGMSVLKVGIYIRDVLIV